MFPHTSRPRYISDVLLIEHLKKLKQWNFFVSLSRNKSDTFEMLVFALPNDLATVVWMGTSGHFRINFLQLLVKLLRRLCRKRIVRIVEFHSFGGPIVVLARAAFFNVPLIAFLAR